MDAEMPEQGLIFWPVGNGDSTTIVVDDEHVVQVDLCDLAKAREEDAPVSAVVDRLVEALPTSADGKPYLAAFILTHADRDHCTGFADLLDRVRIGEIWATPRLWREYAEPDGAVQLCEDAKAFQEEAERRVARVCKAIEDGVEPASGDRIRVIGYDTDREKHAYSELPDKYVTYPGDAVTSIDATDMAGIFEVFIHAPFKDDCAAARNDTSVAMQVTLKDGSGGEGHALFFGDLAYETIIKIFDYSEGNKRSERLAWDVMLAAHHGSKKVMYVAEGGEEVLKQDILDAFSRHGSAAATVVISSAPFSAEDSPGDNPPHCIARERYEEVTDVICTAEYPSEDSEPILFTVGPSGFALVEAAEMDGPEKQESSPSLGKVLAGVGVLAGLLAGVTLARRHGADKRRGLDQVRDAVASTRGDTAAPQQPVGFGFGD
jgi:beta-lactamase superfamily II metal-dependent hydrolase